MTSQSKTISINGKMVDIDTNQLDLSFAIAGTVPDGICQLTQLTTLSLSHNKLTILPDGICRLTNLTILDLSHNKLTILPDGLCELMQLTELYLHNNQLTILPDGIGQLTQLTILYLGNNKLTILPDGMWKLTQMRGLYLNYNKLTILPDGICELMQLTILYLNHNKLTLPDGICELTQLTILNLTDNQLTKLPDGICRLTNLTTLELSNNELTTLPDGIGQLTQLTKLNLGYNKLTILPDGICRLTNLTILDLSDNQLTMLPIELGQLVRLTWLCHINNPIENLLNPIIHRLLQRINYGTAIANNHSIYEDTQNVHSSSIQQSIKDSINKLMTAYIIDYPLTYLEWTGLNQKTKEIITEYMDCSDVHSMLHITFKELFVALVIEMDNLSQDIQIEIQKRLNEEMLDSECKCFTGRISRLVNCLSGYSDKVKIQISEKEEIGNIIGIIMGKREAKTIEVLKEEIFTGLKERGYGDKIIEEWLKYVE